MKLTKSLIKVVHLIQYSNMVLKIEKCCFLTALNQKVLQGIKKSLEDVRLDAKIY